MGDAKCSWALISDLAYPVICREVEVPDLVQDARLALQQGPDFLGRAGIGQPGLLPNRDYPGMWCIRQVPMRAPDTPREAKRLEVVSVVGNDDETAARCFDQVLGVSRRAPLQVTRIDDLVVLRTQQGGEVGLDIGIEVERRHRTSDGSVEFEGIEENLGIDRFAISIVVQRNGLDGFLGYLKILRDMMYVAVRGIERIGNDPDRVSIVS